MKLRAIYVVAALLLVALTGWAIWHAYQDQSPAPVILASPVPPSPAQPTLTQQDGEPKLFKDDRFPPQTPEEKAMWDWWNRMHKADPQFEWKRPISFYGRVIDQYGQPVPGASVKFEWTNISVAGTGTAETLSDGNGLFSLMGQHGKTLSVDITKGGYLEWPKSSRQGFEYAGFFEPTFYVPDSNVPIIFRLWKINGSSEPLIHRIGTYELANNSPSYIDLQSGTAIRSASQMGDVGIRIVHAPSTADAKFDYSITIFATNGGGIVESTDDFMVMAPDTGYRPSLDISGKASDPRFTGSNERRFYLQTGSGKYAAIDLQIGLYNMQQGGRAQLNYFYNPSGSRNLEYDPSKQINQ